MLLYEDIFNLQAVCRLGKQVVRYPLEARPPFATLAYQPVPGVYIQSKVPAKFAAMNSVSKRPAAAPTRAPAASKQKDEDQEEEEEEKEEDDCVEGEAAEENEDAPGGAEEEEEEQEEEEEETKDSPSTKKTSGKEKAAAKAATSQKATAAAAAAATKKRPASAIQKPGDDGEVQALYKHQSLKGSNIREYILAGTLSGKKHCICISKKETNNYQGCMKRLLTEAKTKVDEGISLGNLRKWAVARKAELIGCHPREPTTKTSPAKERDTSCRQQTLCLVGLLQVCASLS